jgi:hypothetical protein
MACLVPAGEQLCAHGFRKSMICAWPWHLRDVARGRLHLKCDGTRAESRFHLSAKRTCPFKSAGVSVQSTTGSRGVRISGSNAGYTMFRGSVKSTGYPLHSPVSPSLPLPCVTVCHHISPGLYHRAQKQLCLSVCVNQLAAGCNDVSLIIRWLQCGIVTRNCGIGFLSAALRKFVAFRIFVVGRKPAVYRVAQKLFDIDIPF